MAPSEISTSGSAVTDYDRYPGVGFEGERMGTVVIFLGRGRFSFLSNGQRKIGKCNGGAR